MKMEAKIIELPKIPDRRGNLTFVEQERHVPFEIRRVYWTYDVPAGEERGGHAHRRIDELLVAVSGSFTVTLDDGRSKTEVVLNRPYQGLHIPAGVWRTLENFASGSVCLVLASEEYDEAEYIRDYDEFLRFVKKI